MKSFKRDIYFQLEKSLKQDRPIFLLGPRKTGKTFVLRQLANDLENCEYYDFKVIGSNDESMNVFIKICEDVIKGVDKVYLLDEMTYSFCPQQEIAKVAGAFTEAEVRGVKVKTKIVFTGSQSRALEGWGHLAFCGGAEYFKLDFLSYPEWLRFKGITEVSAETYISFIGGVREFYSNIGTIEQYLKGCIEETIQSAMQTRSFIKGMEYEGITVELAKSVMYLVLLSLHDSVSSSYLRKSGRLKDRLQYMRKQDSSLQDMSENELADRIARAYVSVYDSVLSVDVFRLRRVLAFLIRCGLITATPVVSQLCKSVDVLTELESLDSLYKDTEQLLSSINVTVRYPMFMVDIIKDIFGSNIDLSKHMALVGSVLECQARGLLPVYGAVEYRDQEDREIDYINIAEGVVIEFTVSNKRVGSETNFNVVNDSRYKKILLTRDKSDVVGDVVRIPYYEFISKMSGQEDARVLLKKLVIELDDYNSELNELKRLGADALSVFDKQ